MREGENYRKSDFLFFINDFVLLYTKGFFHFPLD